MDLKLVVLDDFFANSHLKLAQKYFSMLVGMKKAGYWSKHNNSYLPFAQNDFICTHVFLVDSTTDDIVLAFKLVRKKVCEKYSISFTMNEYLIGEDQSKTNKIQSRLEEIYLGYKNITYSGGWTINPKFKGFGKTNELKDIYTGVHYLVNQYLKTDIFMGIGVMNFKTHLFFRNVWGMSEMSDEIFNFASCSYLDCKFYELNMHEASLHKHRMAKKYKYMWEEALLISDENLVAKVS